ncbi:hypothetical protein JHK82_024365 [Glycine max]|nr:hypothetical protein JHK85_024949 [Glycine max]KAG5012196.1 hypothetical protein JHK86_024457 [Glycine max]KAG5133177.1 hypothetical protein JHK82_024365 [Glycine max]
MLDLLQDVQYWEKFYLWGRLQKPVYIVVDNLDVNSIKFVNLRAVVYSNFLHASRVEISKLKMSIEGSSSGNNLVVTDVDNFQPESLDKYKEEINKLQMEVERRFEDKNFTAATTHVLNFFVKIEEPSFQADGHLMV